MVFNRTPPLEERLKSLLAEIDAFIDVHVAAIKKDCPGVPEGAIRNSLRGGCQCAQYFALKKQDDDARESAA